MQNAGGKLVEGLVSRDLAAALDPQLPGSMGAYRRGRATWLNVGQVAHLASEAFEARQHVLTVSLDLQDAYNMVSVPTLVRILLDKEVNPYLVRWILAAFQSRRCALKCGRWLSEWTNVMMALPQGSPLSPVCFNAYTLPIADMTLPLNMKLFTFADDLLLVGTGKSLDLLQSQMQETLDSLNVICQRASMTVNPAKASSCVFSLSRRTLPPCQLRYAGQPILSEDTVTHLGITLDKGLSFNTHVEKIVSSCTRSLGVLKMAKRKGVNQARLLQLYRSLVQSRLLYGAEVITASASALEKLDRVQTSALRIVHRLHSRHRPGDAEVHGESAVCAPAGVDPASHGRRQSSGESRSSAARGGPEPGDTSPAVTSAENRMAEGGRLTRCASSTADTSFDPDRSSSLPLTTSPISGPSSLATASTGLAGSGRRAWPTLRSRVFSRS